MQINDVKAFDQKLSLIFHAIIAGPLIIYCYGYLQTLGNETAMFQEPTLMIKLFVSIFCGFAVLMSFFLYRREVTTARALETLEEKLSKLFTGSIIHYALLEVASFIAAIAFLVTHDHLFTAVYLFILFLMSINRPTPRKYVQDLFLRGEERETVLKKETIR